MADPGFIDCGYFIYSCVNLQWSNIIIVDARGQLFKILNIIYEYITQFGQKPISVTHTSKSKFGTACKLKGFCWNNRRCLNSNKL